MQKATTILAAVASILCGSAALADATCEGPIQEGNTWNLVCAADDQGDAETEYQCDYVLSVTNEAGLEGQTNASGSVGKGLSGVIIWSNIQFENGDIASASIVSGSCVSQ